MGSGCLGGEPRLRSRLSSSGGCWEVEDLLSWDQGLSLLTFNLSHGGGGGVLPLPAEEAQPLRSSISSSLCDPCDLRGSSLDGQLVSPVPSHPALPPRLSDWPRVFSVT